MKEITTGKLEPIHNFKNHINFDDHIRRLVTLFYPLENYNNGKIVFQQGAFEGVTVKVQLTCIYLELDYNFIKDKTKLARENKQELAPLNVFFHYTPSNRTVYMYPWERNNFPDTEYGGILKANYFFLVVQAALNHLLI